MTINGGEAEIRDMIVAAANLFCWPTVGTCGEGQKHRVTQEVKIRLKAWCTQSCSKIHRQCTLYQSTNQMTKGSCEWILLTARFNLVQLHLLEENEISATLKAHTYTYTNTQ